MRRAPDDRGTAAADWRSADDIRRSMENDEVLACFLDLGEDGKRSQKLWSEKLQDVPPFEATCITRDLDGLEMLREQFPPIIKDGWLNELGRAVLHDAQKLAKIFIQSMSYRKTDGSKSDVQKLRIRLACVDHVQCPRVHWDDVPLRLVCTLAGAGTEVLPEGRADRGTFQDLLSMPLERQVALNSKEWNQRVSRGVSHRVGQGQAGLGDLTPVPDGWAVLLKGSAWHGEPGASPGALHCSPREASKRVLLQVDLAEYL